MTSITDILEHANKHRGASVYFELAKFLKTATVALSDLASWQPAAALPGVQLQ